MGGAVVGQVGGACGMYLALYLPACVSVEVVLAIINFTFNNSGEKRPDLDKSPDEVARLLSRLQPCA